VQATDDSSSASEFLFMNFLFVVKVMIMIITQQAWGDSLMVSIGLEPPKGFLGFFKPTGVCR
jgi:hypothetical protein